MPLLRHLARVGRPLVDLGAMAPSSLPTVDLMHPTQIAKLFHRAGWIYEEKVDGWRMVAIKSEHGGRLVSRNGRDHTRRFPELVKRAQRLRGHRREESRVALRAGPYPGLAQGEAAALSRGRARVGAEGQALAHLASLT